MKPNIALLGLALAFTGCSEPAKPPPADQVTSKVAPSSDSPGKIIRVLVTPDCVHRADINFEPYYEDWDSSRAQPFTFKDLRTNVTFYVESDGRHLSAIDSSGNLLWVRNPFVDADLCHYRTPWPVIRRIEAVDLQPDHAEKYNKLLVPEFKRLGMDFAKHRFIRIHFDSSQFGIVDETSGNFFFEGQD